MMREIMGCMSVVLSTCPPTQQQNRKEQKQNCLPQYSQQGLLPLYTDEKQHKRGKEQDKDTTNPKTNCTAQNRSSNVLLCDLNIVYMLLTCFVDAATEKKIPSDLFFFLIFHHFKPKVITNKRISSSERKSTSFIF